MSSFRTYIIEKSLESTKFKFGIYDHCGQNWYDVDCVGNSNEMKFIKQYMIKAGDLIFDCGAHQGYTSLMFSNWTGARGKVHSFEPHPGNFDILCENIRLNNSLNIFPYNVALGNQDGICYMSPKSNSKVVNRENGVQTKMIHLDHYVDFKPNFIKIDVEGFEMKVLQGASKILSAGHTRFSIEIHPKEMKKYQSTVDDLLSLIKIFGFECFIQWTDNIEPTAFNGEEINDRVHLFLRPLQ